MEISSARTSRLGAFGLGAAMLLGVAGCGSSVHAPANDLMGADINNDGVFQEQEASKFLVDRFDIDKKGFGFDTHSNRRDGLSLDEIEKARQFGEQAKRFTPEYGRIFLETLAELEKTYRDPFEQFESTNSVSEKK